jgi:ATP citrate (pro-S)-lyase
MIYPFSVHHIQKFYWETKETLLPVYTSLKEAISKHPDVVVTFQRSICLLEYPRVLGA